MNINLWVKQIYLEDNPPKNLYGDDLKTKMKEAKELKRLESSLQDQPVGVTPGGLDPALQDARGRAAPGDPGAGQLAHGGKLWINL